MQVHHFLSLIKIEQNQHNTSQLCAMSTATAAAQLPFGRGTRIDRQQSIRRYSIAFQRSRCAINAI